MSIRFLTIAGFFLGFILLHCDLPQPPPGPESAEVSLILNSSSGNQNDSIVVDTVGKITNIGMILYLTHYIDSVAILVTSGSSIEYSDTYTPKKDQRDTILYPVTFRSAGDRTITITGYIQGQPNSVVTGTIRIVNRPKENQKPVLTIKGLKQYTAGDTVLLHVSAIDPDTDQTVTINAIRQPGQSIFSADTFKWVTTIADTGIDSIIFIAQDSYTPSISDTAIAVITVNNPDLKKPVITLRSPSSDTTIAVDSLVITAICNDESGIRSLVTYLDTIPFTMTKSSTTGDLWTGTVKPLTAAGKYSTIKLIATDSSKAANKDSVIVRVKYDSDTVKPVMTKVTPAHDSAGTNSSSYTITVNCKDQSGIASVKGASGTKAFMGSRGSGDSWTIAVTDLSVNVFSTITVTATDSSLRANTTAMNFFIKYDPTMLDTIPPTIIQKSGPISGTVVNRSFIEIRDSIYDPSGIDSVYWTLNDVWAGTLTTVSGSPNIFQLKDTVTTFHNNRIVIHAIDDASRKNHDSLVVLLDYNVPPSLPDTTVSTNKNSEIAFTLTAQSPDNDPITWNRITDPSHGTVSGTLPQLNYTPANNYSGADSFLVRIDDNTWSDTCQVRITINNVNFPPQVKDSAVTTREDTSVTFPLSGSDPDGTPLSGWTITKQGLHGTALIAISPANLITYTPAENFAGKDTFYFRAGDGSFYDTGSIIVTITAVNDLPVISRNSALTVLEGGSGTVNTSRLDFTDPDNSPADFEITFTTLVKNGTLALSGVPLLLSSTLTYNDLTSPGLTYTHNGSETAVDSFSFSISDGQASTTGTFSFTISMVNDMPSVSKTGSQMKSTCGIGNIYYDTLLLTDPEGACSSMSVTMIPSDAKAVINSSGRVIISWLADFNRYAYNQSLPCTLKVVDGTNTLSVGWGITVGQHNWTRIFRGEDVGTHMDVGGHFAAADSFNIYTGYLNMTISPLAALYRCLLNSSPSWTSLTPISVSKGLSSFICKNSRLLVGDFQFSTVYSFNTSTNLKADSVPGYNFWNGIFLADNQTHIYTYRSNELSTNIYQNGTAVFQLDDQNNRMHISSAVSSSSYLFLLIAASTRGVIARVSYPLSSTSSYLERYSDQLFEGKGTLFSDQNNADTIYINYNGQINRVINFPISSTPEITSVSIPPPSTGANIMNLFSGSVGWYSADNILYFTRDGFASSIPENLHSGFIPSAVIVSGDKKAVFVVGVDKSVYRY